MQTKDKLAKMEDVKIAHDHVDFTDRVKKGAKSGALIIGDLLHNTVDGYDAIAEGNRTTASGNMAHAEGYGSKAIEDYSHAEGSNSMASGNSSHAEGANTVASGNISHAEGWNTKASSNYQHVSGKCNIEDANDTYAEIIGNGTADNARSNARTLDWNGNEVLAGKLTLGANPTNDMDAATKKMVDDVDMSDRIAKGTGTQAVVEGQIETNRAKGNHAHAEGQGARAEGEASHAEGYYTFAYGSRSHAEGEHTNAVGGGSHSEGSQTTASGRYSHAEGSGTTASGERAHAEGAATTASGRNSHAEGQGTLAARKSQHVFGEYNVEDTSGADGQARGDYIEIVGNGAESNSRSNARTLDWSGNEVLAGKLTVGAAPTADMDVATKKYIDDIISALRTELGLT